MKINVVKLAERIREEVTAQKLMSGLESGTFVAYADGQREIQVTVTNSQEEFILDGQVNLNPNACIEGPLFADVEELTDCYDLSQHLVRQSAFSAKAFGPGKRTGGILDHISKELAEVRAEAEGSDETTFNPKELEEWIDLVLLSLDGAWRCAAVPTSDGEALHPNDVADIVCQALIRKLVKNENRSWPDWRTAEPGKAIEHVRDEP